MVGDESGWVDGIVKRGRTHMILVFLAAVWAAFLLPSIIRRYFSRAAVESVDTFHDALRALDHSEPGRTHRSESLMDEAPHSLLPPIATPEPRPVVGTIPRLVVMRADGTPVPLPEPAPVASSIEESPDELGARRPSVAVHPFQRAGSAEERARSRVRMARRRRRDTFLTLVAVTVVTGVLGAIGPLEPLWVITIVSGLATVVFVALAVRVQLLAEERRQKLRYLTSEPLVVARAEELSDGEARPSHVDENRDAAAVL